MRFLEDGGTRCGACLKLKVRVDLSGMESANNAHVNLDRM
jgi:hypothetical protein